ncbi:hypothetical protein BJ508DRAFT_345926 [Ascobolus immersus RN42]|uniref:Uncharacterized protein n=1 Tax=Ascobolus immersus RN42 TaxID=1160509 RepID=A0A3N4H8E7_ASCIM|nr:hypothetical protein BJ508DRAFT_345926 [Ascobolus immersus RN42]
MCARRRSQNEAPSESEQLKARILRNLHYSTVDAGNVEKRKPKPKEIKLPGIATPNPFTTLFRIQDSEDSDSEEDYSTIDPSTQFHICLLPLELIGAILCAAGDLRTVLLLRTTCSRICNAYDLYRLPILKSIYDPEELEVLERLRPGQKEHGDLPTLASAHPVSIEYWTWFKNERKHIDGIQVFKWGEFPYVNKKAGLFAIQPQLSEKRGYFGEEEFKVLHMIRLTVFEAERRWLWSREQRAVFCSCGKFHDDVHKDNCILTLAREIIFEGGGPYGTWMQKWEIGVRPHHLLDLPCRTGLRQLYWHRFENSRVGIRTSGSTFDTGTRVTWEGIPSHLEQRLARHGYYYY